MELSRALWFGSYWGVKVNELDFDNQSQLVEFIINPPKDMGSDQDQRDCFTLLGVLLLELIWKMRNKVVHEGEKISIEKMHRGLNRIFLEHWSVIKGKQPKEKAKHVSHWSRPAHGTTKINCDAAVGKNHSVLSIIARDWRGNLVFAHSKKAYTNVPVQAKAETLHWAIWVASQCNLQKVVIEGDSKICLEAIIKNGPEIPWKIDPIIKDIWSIASHIPSDKYNWVYRGCNAAVHSLVAESLHNAYFGSFDSTFGPP